MAILNSTLFFKSNRSYGVGAIVFDLILEETHSLVNSVTEFKIEDGSTITDHIQNENRTGTTKGLITNFSLTRGILTQNTAQTAFNQIVQLWKDRELVDIVTVLDVYRNVLIDNITMKRDNGDGESLTADFAFTTAKIVKLQQLTIEASVNLTDMGNDLNRQSALLLNAGKTAG